MIPHPWPSPAEANAAGVSVSFRGLSDQQALPLRISVCFSSARSPARHGDRHPRHDSESYDPVLLWYTGHNTQT
jgi:hypothetical protein